MSLPCKTPIFHQNRALSSYAPAVALCSSGSVFGYWDVEPHSGHMWPWRTPDVRSTLRRGCEYPSPVLEALASLIQKQKITTRTAIQQKCAHEIPDVRSQQGTTPRSGKLIPCPTSPIWILMSAIKAALTPASLASATKTITMHTSGSRSGFDQLLAKKIAPRPMGRNACPYPCALQRALLECPPALCPCEYA